MTLRWQARSRAQSAAQQTQRSRASCLASGQSKRLRQSDAPPDRAQACGRGDPQRIDLLPGAQGCRAGAQARSQPRAQVALTTHRATAANQVWCWDITWLPTTVRALLLLGTMKRHLQPQARGQRGPCRGDGPTMLPDCCIGDACVSRRRASRWRCIRTTGRR